MGQQIEIRPHHALSPDDIDALEQRLYEFNKARTGHHDGRDLGFRAERDGEMVGAVAGYSWGGIAELRQVWVDEALRGQGIGRRLLEAALEEARSRGCVHVFLTTYDFQAPGFYRRLGFAAVAEVRDKPLGHSEFVMRWSAR